MAPFLRSHTCTATIVIICISYRQYLSLVHHYFQPVPQFGNNMLGVIATVQSLLSSHVIKTPAVSLSSDPFVCTKQFDYMKSSHTSWPIRARVVPNPPITERLQKTSQMSNTRPLTAQKTPVFVMIQCVM